MPREPRIGQGAVQARPSGCMGPTSAPTRRGARCRVVNLALGAIWWWWEGSQNRVIWGGLRVRVGSGRLEPLKARGVADN